MFDVHVSIFRGSLISGLSASWPPQLGAEVVTPGRDTDDVDAVRCQRRTFFLSWEMSCCSFANGNVISLQLYSFASV